MNAYVYFIGGPNLLKIGHSVSPEGRLSTLRRASPHDLKLLTKLWFEDVEQARDFEDFLHNRLSAYRQRGEWYAVSGHLRDVVYAATVRGDRESIMAAVTRCKGRTVACD